MKSRRELERCERRGSRWMQLRVGGGLGRGAASNSSTCMVESWPSVLAGDARPDCCGSFVRHWRLRLLPCIYPSVARQPSNCSTPLTPRATSPEPRATSHKPLATGFLKPLPSPLPQDPRLILALHIYHNRPSSTFVVRSSLGLLEEPRRLTTSPKYLLSRQASEQNYG